MTVWHTVQRSWQQWLANALLIFVSFMMLLPVGTTLLVSFKQEQDVLRRPPVFFPCDTPTSSFSITACRWATWPWPSTPRLRCAAHRVKRHAR